MSPPRAPDPLAPAPAVEGDAARQAAFRELYATTYADVHAFVRRRVHPSHAEDVVADAMVVAWRRFDEVPSAPGEARAWLFGVARHVMLNADRGQRRRDALAVRVADALGATTTDEAARVVERLDLVAAWRRLAPSHQEALALTVWDGLTSSQAATLLGISPVAYRLRLTRARRALRAHLDHLPARAETSARGCEGELS
ncbi:MAG: RNA polymerase sigma factor [Nocardioides sp.]|uniref:RNA polymerase sigma factor n=1 Tax=Nocardioides sp. TaxID=35761 RepID=UPI003F02D518